MTDENKYLKQIRYILEAIAKAEGILFQAKQELAKLVGMLAEDGII